MWKTKHLLHLLQCLLMWLRLSQPYFERVWGWDSHSRKGTWESYETPKTSEFDCRSQKTLHWSVFYIIGNLSKCRCWKWAHMSHLNIHNNLWQKEGSGVKLAVWLLTIKSRESTRPRCVQWIATHHWKAFNKSYKFAIDLILIGRLSKELWSRKKPGVQIGIISRLLFGSLGTKSHSDVDAIERRIEHYMGEGGGFPRIWAMVSLVSP
jgi:hypothetical protein